MAGDAIKVSPILKANVDIKTTYFPNGVWVNLNNLTDILNVRDYERGGAWVVIDIPTGPN